MTEKIKLPKAVCDALTILKQSTTAKHADILNKTLQKTWGISSVFKSLNDQDADIIMRALVLGYEPELSAEEQIKEIYNRGYILYDHHNEAFRFGIEQALRIHGIHYDWLET